MTGKERQLWLLRRIKTGGPGAEKAAMDLVVLCMDYLHREAWKFGKGHEAEHEDLVSEGICGLLEAVKDFDAGADVAFLTWATPFIRHRMTQYMDRAGAVKLTSYAREKLSREEASAMRNPASLDQLREVVTELGDLQRDPVAAEAEESEAVSAVRAAIAMLPEREAMAVSAYYGIGGPRRLLSDLAEELGVSGSMMSKYLASGLRRLKEDRTLKDIAGC